MGKVATSPLPPRIPAASQRGAKSEVAHKWARWLHHPYRLGDRHVCRAGGKIRGGPQVGKVATSPLPPRGSPPLQSGRAKSEVAHTWARWLHHPCRLGDSHRFRAGGKIRSGPYMGKVATSPLPPRGSQRLQSGAQNQKWPINGQGGYITPTASGIPRASERGGQNQKWPIHGQGGYITPAASGIPTASERGAKSKVAHKWATWLHHPCRLGDPHRFRAGGQIRSGP